MKTRSRTTRKSIKPRRAAASADSASASTPAPRGVSPSDAVAQVDDAPTPARRPAPSPLPTREHEFRLTKANRAVINILQERDIVTNVEPVSGQQISRVRRELFSRPGNQTLLERYAYLLYSSHRIHQAIDAYERLINDFEPSSDALYYLGCCYLILFETREATRVWSMLRTRYPDSPLVAKVDRNTERLRELTGSPAKPKRSPSVRQLLRRIETSLDKVSGEELLEGGSSAGSDEQERDVLFFSLDEIGGVAALETVECLVGEEPDNVDFLDWAAFVQYSNGNFARAAEYYRRLLDLTEANPFAYYYIGEILFRSGQDEKAFAYWERLVDQFAGHQLADKAERTMNLVRATTADEETS